MSHHDRIKPKRGEISSLLFFNGDNRLINKVVVLLNLVTTWIVSGTVVMTMKSNVTATFSVVVVFLQVPIGSLPFMIFRNLRLYGFLAMLNSIAQWLWDR